MTPDEDTRLFAEGILPSRKFAGRRALVGSFLSIGAPIGWLFLRVGVDSVDIVEELQNNHRLYTYLLMSSAFVFTIFGFWLGKVEDRLARSNRLLVKLSQTDALTKLHNRRAFSFALLRETARAARRGSPLSLIMLDLDHFKNVNDEYGHQAGDELLRSLSACLMKGRRAEDMVARYGGEEFAILLPDTQATEARIAAERILADVRGLSITWSNKVITTTISAGVSEYRPGEMPEELLTRVDAALYDAKNLGRDRVCVT